MQQNEYDKNLNLRRKSFHSQFDATFKLKEKGYNESMIDFAKTAFSNLIGGIGYFYGSSLVQSKHNPVRIFGHKF